MVDGGGMWNGLPARIKVGPHMVRIVVGGDELFAAEGFKGEKCWGLWTPKTFTVILNTDQPTRLFAVETLKHEINHAIYEFYALGPRDAEERVVSVMATGWTQIYRDNPRLVGWIVESISKAQSEEQDEERE